MKFDAKLSNTLGGASRWTKLLRNIVLTTVIHFRDAVSEGQLPSETRFSRQQGHQT
jgi:hypothetical protein